MHLPVKEGAVCPSHITIIGAGVIGVVAALQLQQRGIPVLLVDKDDPAQACSSGNAGILAAYGVAPLSLPGILGKVPGMLLDPSGPLSVRREYLIKVMPWLWRFWRASQRDRVNEIATALSGLLTNTLADYQALTRGTEASSLIRPSPILCIYENEQAYANDHEVWNVRRQHGVQWHTLRGKQLHDMEPAIAPKYQFAAVFENCGYTLNSQRLVQVLFDTFMRNGGKFIRSEVQGFTMGQNGPQELITSAGRLPLQRLLIACGAWSSQLTARLGESVPLQAERGYNVTLSGFDGDAPAYPVMSPSQKVIATPMETGLRIAGIVEFGGFLPPDPRRNDSLLTQLNTLFPNVRGGKAVPWMGHRPSLPDSLPVIGPSARHSNVFYAFGHQHVGLTAAPMTGKLIADVVSGVTPSSSIFPFRIDRF